MPPYVELVDRRRQVAVQGLEPRDGRARRAARAGHWKAVWRGGGEEGALSLSSASSISLMWGRGWMECMGKGAMMIEWREEGQG